MPFEPESEAVRRVGFDPLRIPQEPFTATPDLLTETAPAAFRTENEIGSVLSDEMPERAARLDPAFDPFSDIQGYEGEASSFVHANTAEDVAAIKRQIDREREDRATMDAAGAGGLVAGFAAGVLSPINLIPVGGAAFRASRIGASALRGAAVVGAAGAGSTALQEALLLGTQQVRTPTEAAINVAASTVLAGVLGGAVEALSASRRAALSDVIGRDLTPPRVDEPDPMVGGGLRMDAGDMVAVEAAAARRIDEPTMEIPVAARAANDDAMPPPLRERGSAGAAATRADVADFEATETSFGADRLSLDPLGRTLRSPAVRTRQTAQELAESPVMFEKTRRGEVVPIAVETLIKAYDAGLFRGLKALDDAFVRYRLGRERRTGDVVATALADATGAARRAGKLDYKGFREEVGKAMRRNDEHPDPAIAAAAKEIRRQIFEPLKQRAIQVGLLPEDVDVSTADSYLNRLYDIPRIIAQRDRFTRIVGDWLEAEQARKASIQADLADTMTRYERVAPMQKKMARRMEVIDGRIKRIQAQAGERDRYGNLAERRVTTLRDRIGEIEQAQSELAEYIDAINAQIRGGNDDPGLRATLVRMEKDLRALERKDRASLQKMMERADAEEARQAVAASGIEDAIKIVSGTRRPPKPPDLLDFLVQRGGLRDDPMGELRALGAKKSDKPGLFKAADGDGMTIDDALTAAHEAGFFPEFGDEPPTMGDFLTMIDDHLRGFGPKRYDPLYQDQVELLDMVKALEDVVRRAGVDPRALKDNATAARFFDVLSSDGRSLDDLEAETADMIASGAAVPVGAEREAVGEAAGITRAALTRAMNGLRKAKAAEKAADRKAVREGAREQEAAIFELNAERRREILAGRLEKAQTTKAALADTARMFDEQVADLRARMEQTVLDWQGKSTRTAQGALERRSKAEVERAARAVAAGESPDVLPRLRSADREVDRAVRRMLRAETRYERQELDDIADQIIDRIISTPEGRLPYDRAEGGGQGYVPRDEHGEMRGPLKPRVFMIPDEQIEGFLVNDIEELARVYTRSMAPDVELVDRFGRVDMQSQIQDIAREYDQRIRRAETEKERKALEARKQADIRDIAAMRDRMRGTYGLPADPQGIAARASRAVMTLNLVRLLGGVTMASIPDVGRTVMVHGFGRALRSAVVPMVTNLRGVKLARKELQAAGTALDMVLQTRVMGMTDLMENYGRYSRFERGLQGTVPLFATLSSMNVWNVTMKQIAGMVTMSRTLEAADALRRGKISAKERRRLLEMGIPDHVAIRIAELAQEHGSREGGLWLPNTEAWTGPGAAEAVRAFRANLVKEVDRTIITPGQDKPLWLSTPLGRMLGQFKSFSMASQQRILVAGLQQRDMAALNGAILMVSLGMLSYHLRNQIAGRESSDDWRVWVSEGFDRSGLTGWLFEANNMAEKLTRGTVGVNALVGGPQMTRYASRGLWGAMLGPTAGLVEDVAQITGAAATGDWQESDTRAMRRLLPFQNVFYLAWLFSALESGVNETFGVPMRAG